MFNIFKKAEYYRDFYFGFKVSFPIKDGNVETNIISAKIKANSNKQAKERLIKWAKNKCQIKITSIKDDK